MDYVIETNQLTKKYSGKTVVNKVSMHVPMGSIYGFVGENGSGKTTIMRLLMGLSEPSSGTFYLFGVNKSDSRIYEVKKDISAIVESPSLVPTMTARQNLEYACLYYGIKDKARIDEALESVDLKGTGKKTVKNFSLGMRQRLGIAILLLNHPKLLLLDEPMNGLDPQGIAELRDLIINLNGKGITFVISSHILSELEKVSTHWGFISHGHLIEEISNEDLKDKCVKFTQIRYQDVDKLMSALTKLGYKNIKQTSADSVKIYADIAPLKLLTDLQKEKIEIAHIQTSDLSVEDYYLDLIKNGGER